MKKIENYSNKFLMFEVARLRTLFNNLEKDTFQGKEGKWVTLENGQHIFIREGESLDQAVGRLREKPKDSVDIKTNVKSPKDYDFSLLEEDPKYWYYEQDLFKDKTSLAVKDGKVLGAVGYHDDKNEIIVDKIIVAPKGRGKGIGTKLMNNIMEEADKENKKIISYPLDDKARKFFHRLGFTGEVAVSREPKGKKAEKEKQQNRDNFRKRIIKRYKLIVDEYNSRNLRWYWSKHKLDQLIKDEFEGHKGKWITLENGQHIFVREGEGLDDALGRAKPSKEKPVEETFIEAYDKNTKNYLKNNVPVEKISREKFKETTGIDAPKDSNVFYSMGRRKIYFLEGAEATPELMHHEGHHAIWFSRASPVPGFKDDPNLAPQIKAFKKATREEGPVTFYAKTFELSRDRHEYYGENFAEAGQLYRSGKEGKEKLAKYPITYKAYEDFMNKFEEDEERRTA